MPPLRPNAHLSHALLHGLGALWPRGRIVNQVPYLSLSLAMTYEQVLPSELHVSHGGEVICEVLTGFSGV